MFSMLGKMKEKGHMRLVEEWEIYNGDKGYWENRSFFMEYDDGEYIVTEYKYIEEEEFPNKSGLEEVTGMTIEEIVEIAEKQQAACEDMLWEMKESELRRNKVRLFLGLLMVNGTGIWLIIRRGLKKKPCLFCQK